ncbi:zinc finger BED domain-containing protein RICESLEEPER 2-like [Humulus lupulus]|uniref:zinc finger BED domain-containing protein RICESLEEPER 2-like n=1 Tax=Humulus lupulus TaxID=3486 RepID=UPI002B40877B|nr:zinc finger BED domain-containing protein RICESLEEPER 2-like [Humulus lupulus]
MAEKNCCQKIISIEVPSNEGQIDGSTHFSNSSALSSNINESTPPTIDNDSENRRRKLTYVVWQHFKKQKTNGEDKVICNYCERKLVGSSKNGTKHLHDHFRVCPLRKHKDIKQILWNPTKKKDGGTSLGTYTFDQEYSRQQLAGMIILHEYPLNMVEHEGFRNFVNSIQPLFKFLYVPSPQTTEALSKVLMQCLVVWSIDRKLSTLTLDNCTTNDAMMDFMLEKLSSSHLMLGGNFVHMHCCAHISNLIVKEGLDTIKDGVESIRESVFYWTATPKKVENFEEMTRQIKISCTRKLVLDCKARWNSTYLMITSAMIYKNVFSRLRFSEKKYKHLPNERDWLLASRMCDKLRLFYNVTGMFSGAKYPSASLFFPKICKIRLLLNECLVSEYPEINLMAEKMIVKFEKYWFVIHRILFIATVLDPRFKMKLIEYYFPRIYGDKSLIAIERVRKLCLDLVKEYNLNQDNGSTIDHSLSFSEVDKNVNESMDELAGYDLFVSSTTNVDTVKSKIEHYLEEAVLPRTSEFDILAWWKTNGLKYLILQTIAKDVLAISVTTVASESTFSTSGKHVTPHRNRLHPNALEALVCAQDWDQVMWILKLDEACDDEDAI